MQDSKNVIWMVAINHSKSSYNFEVYSDFAIKTWTHYCERYNIDFKVITEHDERYGFPIWNKLDIIDQIDNYDKFGDPCTQSHRHHPINEPGPEAQKNIWNFRRTFCSCY